MTRASMSDAIELAHTWSVRRFYYASGRVEFHRVQLDAYGCAPMYWKLMDVPELPLAIADADLRRHPSPKIRVFVARHYGYHPDFIGPHRDSDYHED
jgi:hypothetical protein